MIDQQAPERAPLPIRHGVAVIPENCVRTSSRRESRDGVKVLVERFEPADAATSERLITVARAKGGLLYSLNHVRVPTGTRAPEPGEARRVADAVWQELDPSFAAGQTFLRAERQHRVVQDGDREVDVPVMWVKYAHASGSYGWVTVGPEGSVVEVERLVRWDYRASRRATEMWDHVGWVAAREGRGPQLPAPAARA